MSVRGESGITPGMSRRPVAKRYELLSCGLRGHVLEGTDAASIRPEDSLLAREMDGIRWYRCLRCDSWVPLPAPEQPARDHPRERDEVALPLRGLALRDRFILRLIAVDRAIHVIVLGTLAIAIFFFIAHRTQLQQEAYTILGDLQGGVGGAPHDIHRGFLGDVDKLVSLRTGTLYLAGAFVTAYAALEAVEMVGLWFARRWAEYLTFVATTVLLPLEIYELTMRLTVLKVLALVINLVIVVYLLLGKRLFGLRGGVRVHRALRERDLGWPALERASPPLPAATGTSGAAPGAGGATTPGPEGEPAPVSRRSGAAS